MALAMHAASERQDLCARIVVFEAAMHTPALSEGDTAQTIPMPLGKEPLPLVQAERRAGLPMPVHVLWGGASRVVGKVPALAQARCFPHGEHREIPGANHLWPEEAPGAFCEVVTELMERQHRPPA